MELPRLKQSYRKQLIKAGVNPQKANRAAITISLEELRFIRDIWPDWAAIVSQIEQENDL